MATYIKKYEAIQIEEDFKTEKILFKNHTIYFDEDLKTFIIELDEYKITFGKVGDYVVYLGEGKIKLIEKAKFEKEYEKYEY